MNENADQAAQNDIAAAQDASQSAGDTPQPRQAESPAPHEAEPNREPDTADSAPSHEESAAPEYSLNLPKDIPADPAVVAEFTRMAGEMGLNNEQAQSLVDFQTRLAGKVSDHFAREKAQTVAGWENGLRADPDFGAQWDRNVGYAKRALAAFGSPGLKACLSETSLGSHPELVKAFARIGRALAEDGWTPAGAPARKASAAEVLYPDHFK